MTEALNWLNGQHSPAAMLIVGAVAVFAAIVLIRLIRRIRRLIWSAGLLVVASSMGVGGGWTFLDALGQWR